MLSVRVMRVRGVLMPDSTTAASELAPAWTVELRYGSEKHRTQFLALAPSTPTSLVQHEPRRTDLTTASGSPCKGDIEIEDRGGEENVDVTLLFDPSPKYYHPGAMKKRQLFRHSMASIDLRAYRSQPEKRMEVWLPLQPANPRQGDSRHFGAIQVAIMYTDDCVAQGYMFGLFCGLSPLWQHKWQHKNPA